MVFKRRDQASLYERAREAIYPRKGWRRGIDYYTHRIKRIPDTPHKIAIGIACGVMVSFTPFFGLHFALGGLLAWAVGGNILAGFIGTFFLNPVTTPAIAAISFGVGKALFGLGDHDAHDVHLHQAFFDGFIGSWQVVGSWFGYGDAPWDKLQVFWHELLLPYLIGGILPGMICAAGVYYLSKPLIAAYQKRRRARLLERARQRHVEKQARAADLPT